MKLAHRITVVVALAAAGLVPAVLSVTGPAPASAARVAARDGPRATASLAKDGSRLWAAVFPVGVSRSGSATALAVSPSQPVVYVAGTTRKAQPHDSVVAYNSATGARLWVATFKGVPHVSLPPGPPSLAVSPDGSTVFVEDNVHRGFYGKTTIRAYNAATGALRWTAEPTGLPCSTRNPQCLQWAGPRSMTVSPDGSQVFLTANSGPNECAYVTIAFNAATGQQNWLAMTPRQVFGFASAIAVSPDGSDVFVTGRTGTVAYSASTGAQVWRDHYKLRWNRYPGYLAVSPDSATVFVTDASSQGTHGAHFVTTAYSAATGAQLWVARYDGGTLTGVTVSPDGSQVFVTGSGGKGFETIAYNAASGAKLWAAPGLGNGTAVAIAASPDGSAVFVTGAILRSGTANEYATVAYSATTGAQLWASRYPGPTGASSSPVALGASPDDSSVFVTGTSSFPSGHTEFATVAYGA